jgi:hypothetical protein
MYSYTVERQISNSYLARVNLSEEESIFIKFPEEPTQTMIDTEVAIILNNRLIPIIFS